MSNHSHEVCTNPWQIKSSPFKQLTTTTTTPAAKKARTDTGYLCITELGSENESGKE